MPGSRSTERSLQRLRVELYLPLTGAALSRVARSFIGDTFTSLFGGCTFFDGLDGQYLNLADEIEADVITMVVSDTPRYNTKERQTLRQALKRLKRR